MSKLLNEVRNTLRVHHYAIKTEKVYVQWIKRYIFFHNMTHPLEMGKNELKLALFSLRGQYSLIGRLLYGSGLRLVECLRLRVMMVDSYRLTLTVYSGKGVKTE
ncbi:MAG: phage integrase N-terminal SAM-like domain-containing protein [Xanthomonadales bacterium]|nr:phage integrase N-terminal SAM-like domain-containing protein [Xanthomonadales bacterium]